MHENDTLSHICTAVCHGLRSISITSTHTVLTSLHMTDILDIKVNSIKQGFNVNTMLLKINNVYRI